MKNLPIVLKKINEKPDIFGSLISGLCLVHCLATPFLFVAHATISDHGHNSPSWWSSLDIIFLGLSFIAIYQSGEKTSKLWVKYALYVSWFILFFILMNEKLELFHWAEEVIYLPTASLIIFHLYNRKYCKCADDQCCTNE
ncbi:MerC domain-containing protein [Flexithrix dorotheae]|uniref:MerC domain-containing protein n=1 Tax=Flexithrix dorotheae TaxID=70993 RepID=UPI00036C97B0|nr:MerC domain-containing protein [Flexithrix dorotheae]